MRSLRALLTLIAVNAGILDAQRLKEHFRLKRSHRAIGAIDLPSECLYEGRWFTNGSTVTTREACLRCVCTRGALSCTRRACSKLPDPPPKRCHVLHRKGSCCPELHCPDGVKYLELSASARFENEPFEDSSTPALLSNACVEGGTVYAAGSAMSSDTACEQCFCLGGGRRCARPQCMPTPPGCRARPSSGACCPQRYYCEHTSTTPPEESHQYDCQVSGKWVVEGDRVNRGVNMNNCSECFCLRGEVQCQPLACARPLMGCQPLLRPGDCCPHRYHCDHQQGPQTVSFRAKLNQNADFPLGLRQVSLLGTYSKMETTKNSFIDKHTPFMSTSNHVTTKVKRKTSDPPPEQFRNSTTTTKVAHETVSTEKEPKTTISENSAKITKINAKAIDEVTTKLTATAEETTTELVDKTTVQPEGTMRIMINGTINCTAELSSTSISLNDSFNDTERITMEAQPRVPLIDTSDLEVTFSPNDIITDRSVSDFDENETFTINVTSSLRANTSLTTKIPEAVAPVSKIVPTPLNEASNSSKKTKGDYDYDYTEPTLPPSLPNLKIIPFVAADAVVEDETPKADMTYPSLDRNDKFPVYYPNIESKEQEFPTRREDVYNPTQYPVFISEKVSSYPTMGHDDLPNFSNSNDREYTSFAGRLSDNNRVMKATTNAYDLETPIINMFSPPQETEGGFVPKDPSVIDDYFSVFPSTPSSGVSVPHLTTSMQLDITKGGCISSNGHRISEGASIAVGCSDCKCLWGELRCSPRLCPRPMLCTSSAVQDPCCEPLICKQDNFTASSTTTQKIIPKTTSSTEAPRTNSPPIANPKNNTEVKTNLTNKKPDVYKNQVNSTVSNISTTQKPTQTTVKMTKKPLTYEDDDEEEFSFGSVLKLLLSEYETTTVATKTKPTRKPLPSIAPFIPLPPYTPPKSVNRIDHLILGESSALTTQSPTTKITRTTTPTPTTKTTTKIPKDEPTKEFHYSSNEVKATSNLGVPGLLKLAGCNIYGRMYRVGRIIAELSTPCQECWCTELGVQCKPLNC